MKNEELANFIKLVNSKARNSSTEAKKFQTALMKRIQDEEKRNEENIKLLDEAKETIIELKQNIEELTKANIAIEKQMHSNYETMNQVIRDHQQKITELETEQNILQQNNQNHTQNALETSRIVKQHG